MFKRFAPGIPLTVTMLIALSILIGLGTWQARKIGPKTDLLSRIEAGLNADAIELPVHVDDPTAIEYRNVSFKGQLNSDKPARIYGLNLEGKPGYYLYAPVQRPFGMAVIVNFGWVPMEHTAEIKLPLGDVELSGVLRTSATPGQMTPENVPAEDKWFTADVHQLAAHFGLRTKEYYHFRIFADHQGEPAALPRGGQVRVSIPNDHFEYMLTWYGIALGLVAVYIAFGFKSGRKEGL
jgi:surfeit locus 1 family protein